VGGRVILAIDIGLSAVKATLATRAGEVVQAEREPYPTLHAGPRAEQDPGDWWEAARAACARLAGRHRVDAVVPTGHMHALVLLDERGTPLLPCLTLHDRRGAEQLLTLDAAAFHAVTGQFLEPALPLAKLLWLAAEEPALLERARLALAPKDELGRRLSGVASTDPLDAAGTGLYATADARWAPEILALTGLPERLLPPVERCAAVRGPVLPSAARALGLPETAVVLTGAGDDIELLGATGYRPGAAVEHVGTSGAILRVPERLERVESLELQPTAVAGRLAVGAAVANCAAVIAWIETVLGVPLADALAAAPGLDDPVARPHLLPERGLAADAGALVAGLRFHHDRRDLARALLIGVAGTLRELLDRIERESGDVGLLVASGSPDRAWAGLRAASYERPIALLAADPTALGCVALGMVALGEAAGAEAAAARLEVSAQRLEPDPERVAVIRALRERAAYSWQATG
jgi:xylulokinase